jgi:hypothetical protein
MRITNVLLPTSILLLMGVCGGGVLVAQSVAPIGIVRGDMVEWKGTKTTGELIVRSNPDGEMYTCSIDNYSYLERASQRIHPAALEKGEKLEIIADRKAGGICYARTVRVAPPERHPAASHRAPLRTVRSPMLEALYPRGNITYAGVVVRLAPGVLVLRTNRNGEQSLLLRQDTRFLKSGFPSESDALAINERVFVRCGKNLENELEVYQIIWGRIEGP